MQYVNAFWVGGLICVAGQILIDKTKLTPARILTGFVVAGVILGAIGLYKPLVDFAGAGGSVPISGFGKAADGTKVDNTTVEANITNSTSVMMTSVAGDPYAIGYISLGSLNDTVKAVKIDGAEATTYWPGQ